MRVAVLEVPFEELMGCLRGDRRGVGIPVEGKVGAVVKEGGGVKLVLESEAFGEVGEGEIFPSLPVMWESVGGRERNGEQIVMPISHSQPIWWDRPITAPKAEEMTLKGIDASKNVPMEQIKWEVPPAPSLEPLRKAKVKGRRKDVNSKKGKAKKPAPIYRKGRKKK